MGGNRLRFFFAALVLTSTLAGCGGNGSPSNQTPEGCVPGEITDCTCEDGHPGVRTCQDDGETLGACSCWSDPMDGGTTPDSGTVPSPISVEMVSPPDGTKGVAVDRTLVITFSGNVDPETVDGNIWVMDGKRKVAGKFIVDHRVVSFLPALLLPLRSYTVKVTKGVKSIDGLELTKEFTSQFQSGGTLQNGVTAPTTLKSDLLPPRFLRITRQAEFALIADDKLSLFDPQVGVDSYSFPQPVDVTSATGSVPSANQNLQTHAALDKDFREDLVVLSVPPKGPGTLFALLSGDSGFTKASIPTKVSLNGVASDTSYHYALKAADVDGDGFEEILVAGWSGKKGRVWIIDDAVHDYGLVKTMDLPGLHDILDVRLAPGNFDRDINSEFFVVYRSTVNDKKMFLLGYDDAASGFKLTIDGSVEHPLTQAIPAGGPIWDVAAGKTTSAHTDVLVIGEQTLTREFSSFPLSYWYTQRSRLSSIIPDWKNKIFTNKQSKFITYSWPEHQQSLGNPAPQKATMTIGNVTPDEKAEIIFGSCIYDNDDNDDYKLVQCLPRLALETASGDIDSDGRLDLVGYGAYTPQIWTNQLQSLSYHETALYDEHTGDKLSSHFAWRSDVTSIPFQISSSLNASLVDVDMDRDSTVLTAALTDDGEATVAEPDDDHQEQRVTLRQVFKDNVILAVLAGPPCSEELGQHLSDCSTGFGTMTSGTVTAGGSLSVHAYVGVGFQESIQGGAGFFGAVTTTLESVSASVKADVATSVYASLSINSSLTITDYAGAGEDLVVFFTVPYNRYEYQTVSVSSKYPGGEKLVGEPFVVEVPLLPRLMAVSRSYYNRTNGNEWDIGKDVLPNEPGNLSTYPSFADIVNITNGYVVLGAPTVPITVGEGAGHQEIEMSFSQDVTAGGSLTLSTEVEAEVCGSFVCSQVGGGVSTSVFAEATLGTGTIMSGSVAAIPEDKYPGNMFQYGMFAYLRMAPVGPAASPFIVVNYYVEK